MSKVKIAETPSGFSSLGKNLDKWVDKKIKEIAGIQITDVPAGEGAFREVADCLTD